MEFITGVVVILIFVIIGKLVEYHLRKPYIDGITNNKYVFITGCDTGFGNKLARQLDAKGVNVIASCLTENGRTELNDATSDRVATLQMDVTSHESIVRAFEEVKKILPHPSALWGVVNNAGIANVPGYIEWSRREDYEKVLAVNLFGTIDVTLTFLPLLKKSRGRLVNVTSCAGRAAVIPGGYCESKFALEAFTDVFRKQQKSFGYGIKVCIIEPGLFATNLASLEVSTRSVRMAWDRLSNEEKEEFPETMMKNFCLTGVVTNVYKMEVSWVNVAQAAIPLFIVCKFLETLLRIPFISNITNRYVFITGCDTGFGHLLAKRLDSKGVRVIATCLTEQGRTDLENVTSERLTTILMDVTKHDSIVEAYDRVRKILPNESDLWGVVNNAGVGTARGFLEWTRREDYEKTAAVNLFGAIDVSLTFLPLLKNGGGRLVQMSSIAGRLTSPVMCGGYPESKFGLEAFSDTARREFIHRGYPIKVSLIQPSFVATGIISPENIARGIDNTWQRLSPTEQAHFPSDAAEKRKNETITGTQLIASRDPLSVVRVMEHALLARWPKTRYTLGLDGRLIWAPISYLPTCISDPILALI